MDLLSEGVSSITLACTLAILAPGLLFVLVSQQRAAVTAPAYVIGVALLAWLRFGGWVGALDSWAANLVVAVVLTLAALGMRASLQTAIAGGLLAGGLISLYWRPCVGLEFADILNRIPDEPAATLPAFVLFVIVLLCPVLALAAIPHAWPQVQPWRDHPNLGRVSLVSCALLSLAIAFGWFEALIGELFRLSS